jgi:aminoglycoside 3-N-acetyltransferase
VAARQDIERGLRELALGKASHVLAHASYKSFGGVQGGPSTVVRGLVESLGTVMMPAFTWARNGVWDPSGVFAGNAYRSEPPDELAAIPFRHDTPIDNSLGVIPETFRTSYAVSRSSHPLQSFIAYGELADRLTAARGDTSVGDPIQRLADASGVLLLLGVTHTSSTAVHLAEQLAGRQLFVRHALTPEGVRAVRAGGCGEAFDDLQPHVEHLERLTKVGGATLRCYPLAPYVETARRLILRDPFALLCETCDRCRAHRSRVVVA